MAHPHSRCGGVRSISAGRRAGGSGDPRLVASFEAAFAKAFAERDLETFLSYVDEDALFLGRTALRGRDEVAETWGRFFESETAPFSWEPKRWELNPSGSMGLTTGPVYDPEGNHVGAFMSIWRRQPDGTWKVIFDGGPECPPARRDPDR